MKIFLTSAMLLFLTLSAILPAQTINQGYSSDICTECDQNFKDDICIYIHKKIKEINQILINYELNGDEHYVGFDYHVGYLNGQYEAYNNINNKMKSN